jgi:hypothetical protein
MTTTNRDRYLSFLVVILLCAVPGYRYLRASPFDGTWVKLNSKSAMPDEMTVRVTPSQFTTRYRVLPWGEEHVTLKLDGHEHFFQSMASGGVKTTYYARLDGGTVIVTKHFEAPDKDLGSFTEKWSVIDNGRKLMVSVQGSEAVPTSENQTIFRKRSFLRSLFVGGP